MNAMLSSIILYLLYGEIIDDEKLRKISVLMFSTSWYYTLFHANYLREVYAFPLSLLLIYSYIKMLKQKKYEYIYLTYLLYVSIVFTHHYTSYLTIIIATVISFGYYIYEKQIRGFYYLLSMIVILLICTSEIFSDVTISYIFNTVLSFKNILQTGTLTILPGRTLFELFMSLSYYMLIGLLMLLGLKKLISTMRENGRNIYFPFIIFFCILFVVSILLRVSAAGQWSYYLSHRATIWAYLGISILMAYGFDVLTSLFSNEYLKHFLVILIFCILAIGKFSQYPPEISDGAIPQPVSFLRYQSALWLKDNANMGDWFLISYSENASNRLARHMSPYSNQRQYNLNWLDYEDFYGYIPFLGPFYSQYMNDANVAVIYSNGEVNIGYKSMLSR